MQITDLIDELTEILVVSGPDLEVRIIFGNKDWVIEKIGYVEVADHPDDDFIGLTAEE